jgi:hypothetical protein
MAEVGDVVRCTSGAWIVLAPRRCPQGHPLDGGRVLVGYAACRGHGGGHTTWTCCVCGAIKYGPALGAHCTVLSEPAAVRISTAKPQG